MKVDLIVHNAGQLVTCSSPEGPKRGIEMADVGMVPDGAVAVAEGKVVAVGASTDILSSYGSDDQIDAQGAVICPGFVDPHTHIVFAGDRLNEFELKIKGADYLEILANGGGIISTVKNTRAASFDDLVEQSRKRLDKMLACGTTTVEIKTGYGLDTDTELKMLEVIAELARTHVMTIVPTFLAAHAVPPEFKNDPDAYVELICSEMLPRAWHWYSGSGMGDRVPFYCDVFCEKGAFDIDQSTKVLEAARSLGFGLKAHADEFTNLGGSRLSIGSGAVSIDHLDAISDDEIKLLSASDTVAVVTPTVNFNFGSAEFADARAFIDADCAVALSTDYNPGSAPSPSQPMAMAIACRYQKLLPSEALNAATINAAHAIGLGSRVGSLEAGKSADLLILNCTDYRQIANEFGASQIASVFKNGKRVYPHSAADKAIV